MLELLFEFLNFLKATSYAGTRTNIRTGAQDTSNADLLRGNDLNQFGERNRRMRKIRHDSRFWQSTGKWF